MEGITESAVATTNGAAQLGRTGKGDVIGRTASNPVEGRQLGQLEAVIERGREAFVEAGWALLEIRQGRLYREQYSSFGAYCHARWGWSRTHVHRLIDAARVVGLFPIGNGPRTESHARQLAYFAKRDPKGAIKLWHELIKTHGGDLTAAEVKQAVRNHMDKKQDAQATANLSPVPSANWYGWVVSHFRRAEKISADAGDLDYLLQKLAEAAEEGRDVSHERLQLGTAYRKAAELLSLQADKIEGKA
jgi:hypothetical protein